MCHQNNVTGRSIIKTGLYTSRLRRKEDQIEENLDRYAIKCSLIEIKKKEKACDVKEFNYAWLEEFHWTKINRQKSLYCIVFTNKYRICSDGWLKGSLK